MPPAQRFCGAVRMSAGADLASKQVAVRLTLLEKRVKALEESWPDV
jgi:hypothetical protein